MRFNGAELEDVHPVLSICKEYPPGMAAREVHLSVGNDGSMLAGVQDKPGLYRVRVNIAGRNEQEGLEACALLAAWATSSGERTALIEPTHDMRRGYMGICENIEDPEFKFGFAQVDVRFLLPDAKRLDLMESRAAGMGGVDVQIGGSAACRPVICQKMDKGRDGLLLTMDQSPLFAFCGRLESGQEITVDFDGGTVTVNGVHREPEIDYTRTRWHPGFFPGRHSICSNDAGEMGARWRNRWR